MKIKHYSVIICDGSGIFGKENSFAITEYNVLGENDHRLVIDDTYFTTLSKSKSDSVLHPSLDGEKMYFYTNDTCWGNRMTYSLYTTTKVKAETVRRHIEKEVAKRFGFFARGMDLSFIRGDGK